MPDYKQVKLIRSGSDAWNTWRKKNPSVVIDLTSAHLRSTELIGFDFSGADLTSASLISATFRPSLRGIASLTQACLLNANLAFASIVSADITSVNFHHASLIGTRFTDIDLSGCDFKAARMGLTSFNSVDLSGVRTLEAVLHESPSFIDINTLRRSEGRIPAVFLRGCGFSELEITMARLYDRSLSVSEITDIAYKIDTIRNTLPIQVSPVFISYSHADDAFVKTLERLLDAKGIRYWRDVHKLVAGRLERQIDVAIRLNPIVILVLSLNSAKSDWVEWEAIRARELEKELGRDVLCPVALDDSWKTCDWDDRLRRQILKYNVLDFSGWTTDEILQKQFDKLVKGLGLYYR